MKVTFVTNYFNHHQKYLCDKLDKLTEGNFSFISNIPILEERKKLGYGGWDEPEYVIRAYEDDNKRKLASDRINEADVILAGTAPEEMITSAINSKKLVFRYSERIFKKKYSPLKLIPRGIKYHIRNPRRFPIYLLCASAYASADFARFGLFKKRSYKWGYFPKCFRYDDINALMDKKNCREILWCGRFLNWKHPDDVLRAVKKLKDNNYNFHMNFIGTGPMEEELKQTVAKLDLCDVVTFFGTMSPEKVRDNMERAGIYLFTSDFQEGWGAVLNESMNSGCAVIASHAIGSAPYLINNGKNGYMYRSGNIDDLYNKIKLLLDAPEMQKQLGIAAYKTITQEWNAEEAAKRFLCFTEHILSGEKSPKLYKSGPLSKAEILKNNWM